MWFRQTNAEFARSRGDGNRRALQRVVRSGAPAGVLAYAGKEPVGWCAVAPREHFTRLARSRVLQPVDDRPAWSVPCFFVAARARRKGVTARLLESAVAHAAHRGARLVEGYPVEPRSGAMPDLFGYYGIASVFRGAGFREVARRSPTRPVMRLEVGPAAGRTRRATARRPRRPAAGERARG
jgi:GNAT superfamily N-acetyltransferase